MQASVQISSSLILNSSGQDEFVVETAAVACDEFQAKLKIEEFDEDKTVRSEPPDGGEQPLKHEVEDEDDDDDDEEEEEEFSFSCGGIDTSPVAADDAFQDGQIRPIYPLFNQDLLLDDDGASVQRNQLPLRPPVRKVFVEARDAPSPSSSSSAAETDELEAEAVGPYCAWTRKAVEASPEGCKKSNSTGFSKLWRFRDLLNRSNSDGRDAYVFLNGSSSTTTTTRSTKSEEKVQRSESSPSLSTLDKKVSGEAKVASAGGKVKVTKKGGKGQTASLSAHELHYKRNRASKEEDRHRSYLPYRQDLVGFFTNVNGGMSKNVHPF